MRGGRRIRGRSRAVVSDEIRATVIDHVVNHGLSMREDGQRVQPNLQRSTVASIVRVFRQTNRTRWLPQETAIVYMVIRNNGIKLTEIRDRVLADNITFANIHSVSITTISRVLKKTSGQDETVVHCLLRGTQNMSSNSGTNMSRESWRLKAGKHPTFSSLWMRRVST